MEQKQKKIFFGVLGGLVVVIALLIVFKPAGGPVEAGKYDEFAVCLKEKGAIFYGAFWCPHCQDQKKLFGTSAKLLPYEECSTLDGQGQNQICNDKGITGYPTWDFADGTRLNGEIPLAQLAEKSGCVLPE